MLPENDSWFFHLLDKVEQKTKNKDGMYPTIIMKSYLYKKVNDRKGKFLEFEKNLMYVY